MILAFPFRMGPKKGTGTVGKRLNHFKTRLSTEPVPIFADQFRPSKLIDRQFDFRYQG